MERVGYFNGQYGPLDDMMIPFEDRAMFFGDGVYDATIANEGVVLYEEEHLDRFYRSAALMRIEVPFSREELRSVLHGLVTRTSSQDNFLYWQLTRGTAPREHCFPHVTPNLLGYITPLPRVDLTQEVTAHFVEDTRFFHCNAKTLNLLPNVLAAQEAKDHGCDEAIFVRDGYVTECAHANIHLLKDGVLITHPADKLILPGIARHHLIMMASHLGMPVEERPFTPDELLAADEVIMTASSIFARGIRAVDDIPVGHKDRETLRLLQRELTAEFEDYLAAHKAIS